MALFTKTIRTSSESSLERLKKDSKARQDYIDQIKRHVAQSEDNLRHPIPLFQQLNRN